MIKREDCRFGKPAPQNREKCPIPFGTESIFAERSFSYDLTPGAPLPAAEAD
jgi:hypothetical protein